MDRTGHKPGRGGFSLIELLVVIAIIGVLTAIVLPALGAVRATSRQTLATVNARSVGLQFESYMDASDGAYPFIPLSDDPGLPGGSAVFFRWWPQGTFIGTSDPFAVEWAWAAPLSSVAPWEESYPVWVSPGKSTDLPEEPPDFTGDEGEPAEEVVSWRLSSAFLGDPKIWDADSPGDDPALLRAVKRHEVRFPSSKVLLWDTHLAYLRGQPELREGHWDAPAPMAFADGHAEARNPLEADAGVVNLLRYHDDRRLHNTPDGVHGLDY